MINGDLSLGLSLAMDVTALWLTGTLGRRPIRVWSIVAAAILGTLPTLVALITFSRWLETLSIKEAMKKLSDRETLILTLRFFEGKTQMEVAQEIGISQAQVSRLEKAALAHMRKYV